MSEFVQGAYNCMRSSWRLWYGDFILQLAARNGTTTASRCAARNYCI